MSHSQYRSYSQAIAHHSHGHTPHATRYTLHPAPYTLHRAETSTTHANANRQQPTGGGGATTHPSLIRPHATQMHIHTA
jgi:hypothetical protein